MPVMAKSTYPEGIDASWLASDRDGNLAVFIAAGAGPIPTVALDVAGANDVERLICELPKSSEARILAPMWKDDELAERGFFVYDWSDIHRSTAAAINSYELVAAPLRPRQISALPAVLANVTAVPLPAVAFGQAGWIDVRALVACQEPSR